MPFGLDFQVGSNLLVIYGLILDLKSLNRCQYEYIGMIDDYLFYLIQVTSLDEVELYSQITDLI